MASIVSRASNGARKISGSVHMYVSYMRDKRASDINPSTPEFRNLMWGTANSVLEKDGASFLGLITNNSFQHNVFVRYNDLAKGYKKILDTLAQGSEGLSVYLQSSTPSRLAD